MYIWCENSPPITHGRYFPCQSFATLASELPKILNTPRKRSIIPAIKALIPDQYHAQYDRALQHMGTVSELTVQLCGYHFHNCYV